MKVNQQDEEVFEEQLFTLWGGSTSSADMHDAIRVLCEHLKVRIVRTNATKHGNTEIVLIADAIEEQL